jgi:hypothetical protein
MSAAALARAIQEPRLGNLTRSAIRDGVPAKNCIFMARFCIVLRSLGTPLHETSSGQRSDETVNSCGAVHRRFGAGTGLGTSGCASLFFLTWRCFMRFAACLR